MKSRYIRLALVLTLALSILIPQSLFAAPPEPLDLKTDLDRDGIPDDLARSIEAVAEARDQDAAVQEFASRLPYSEQTLALQKEAYELQLRLEKVSSAEEAAKIQEELLALSEKMMEDPGYAETMKALVHLYVKEGIISSAVEGKGATIQGLSWSSLQVGDVMLVGSSGKLGKLTAFLYAMDYSHTGNYHGNSLVYESNADGVRLKPLSGWQESGKFIALARNNKVAASSVQSALAWAEGQYGTNGSTPYNYWYPNKTTNSRLYCSQLSWKIHKRVGVDLDSNSSYYRAWLASKWGWWLANLVGGPAVAPDEVALDGDITIYSSGTN